MGFNFPAAPNVDDVHTEFGLSYYWDGVQWKMGIPPTTPNPYVLKAGDTMLGPLVLIDPNPVAALHAAHKRYVDEMVATMSLWQGTYAVAGNVPDLLTAAPLHGYSWTATTVDPNVPEVAVAGIPGIGGLTIASNDTIVYNANTAVYELIRTPLLAAGIAIQDGPPAAPFHGQTWWDSDNGRYYCYYLDPGGAPGQWVQMSGGGGTNANAIPDDAPTDGLQYARQSPSVGAAPAWTEVTGGGALADDAPSDTLQYARQSATVGGALAWTEVAATATGPLVVPVADAFPASPVQGQMHFLSTDASLYVWFIDASSVGSWVEVSAL